jgi:hypothetical protein
MASSAQNGHRQDEERQYPSSLGVRLVGAMQAAPFSGHPDKSNDDEGECSEGE